jgi:hypothetical protein
MAEEIVIQIISPITNVVIETFVTGLDPVVQVVERGFVPSEPRSVDGLSIALHAVSGHIVVRSLGDGTADAADSSNVGHANSVIGVTPGAVSAGGQLQYRALGEMSDPSFNFVFGPVYFDNLGRLTQVVPVVGFVQQVAIALSQTKIAIRLQAPLVLS